MKNLQCKLSKIAGFEVELTVRGERDFTISAEGKRNWGKVLEFFFGQNLLNVSDVYDAECDLHCLYFTIG